MRRALSAVLVVLFSCGPVVEEQNPSGVASQHTTWVADPLVVTSLQSAGLVTPDEANTLVALFDEAGVGTLYVTPGVPGSSDPIKGFFLKSSAVVGTLVGGTARYTTNAWTSVADVTASTFEVDGLQGLAFVLPARGATGPVDFALRVQVDGSNFWINNGGRNFRVDVLAPVSLEWVGGFSAAQDGLARDLSAAPAFTGHPLTIEVDTYPQMPGVAPVLWWTTDGHATKQSAPMRLSGIRTGQFGNNSRWSAAVPATHLVAGGKVELWVEAKGPQNTLWESRGGQNHRATVVAAPDIPWAALGQYTFSKCRYVDGRCETGWFHSKGVAEPFLATPSEFQAYASNPSLAVDVYVPGVTDNAASSGMQPTFVRVEMYSPFFSGAPGAAWAGHPFTFREKVGNNWRFEWNIREFRSPTRLLNGEVCSVNGDYPYKIRMSADGGQTWRWLGTGGVPSGGANRTMRWANSVSAPQLSPTPSPIFAERAVGSVEKRTVELVNTNSFPVSVRNLAFEDPTGSYTVAVPGCTTLATCTRTLPSGGRFDVVLTFSPTQTGPTNAWLRMEATNVDQPCSGDGVFTLMLEGAGS